MHEGQNHILIQNAKAVMEQETCVIIPENNLLNAFLLKII